MTTDGAAIGLAEPAGGPRGAARARGRDAWRRLAHPDRHRDLTDAGAPARCTAAALSGARWHQWEPVSRDAVRNGARRPTGRRLSRAAAGQGRCHPGHRQRPAALGARAICGSRANLRSRRNPSRTERMSRVYALERTPTLIGAVADHRFVAGPTRSAQIVTALAAGITARRRADVGAGLARRRDRGSEGARPGARSCMQGRISRPRLHARLHAINEALGARGATLDLIEPVGTRAHRPGGFAARPGRRHAGGPGEQRC